MKSFIQTQEKICDRFYEGERPLYAEKKKSTQSPLLSGRVGDEAHQKYDSHAM